MKTMVNIISNGTWILLTILVFLMWWSFQLFNMFKEREEAGRDGVEKEARKK